ncbi:MAG: metallophosphoesterase, partial [Ignavibacteriae bacterium]|nr:metallophosphoesterase [Ignavibacteriota bacterium]
MNNNKNSMRRWVVLAGLVCLALGLWGGAKLRDVFWEKGCLPLPENIIPLDLTSSQETIRFIAVGDTGTGDDDQKRVAEGIGRVCAAQGCDFMLMLGDNFYPHGVKSTQDLLLEERFESIYKKLNKPFVVIAGNHDTQGDLQS